MSEHVPSASSTPDNKGHTPENQEHTPENEEHTPENEVHTPGNEGPWHTLHNLLQSRGLRGKLKSNDREEGPRHDTTWYSICMSPLHLSPCSLDSYMYLTVDGDEYGRGKGRSKMAAKNNAARMASLRIRFEDTTGGDDDARNAYRRILFEYAMNVIQQRLKEIAPAPPSHPR